MSLPPAAQAVQAKAQARAIARARAQRTGQPQLIRPLASSITTPAEAPAGGSSSGGGQSDAAAELDAEREEETILTTSNAEDEPPPELNPWNLPASVPVDWNAGDEAIAGVNQMPATAVCPAVSVKARFWCQGHKLMAAVHTVAAGEPQIMYFELDIRPIAAALSKWHQKEHLRMGCEISGFPGSVWKAAKKIGKSKLMKTIAKTTKSVIRSNVTKAVVATAAVVFPPVGVPAAAAYAGAAVTLDRIEQAEKIEHKAKQLLRSGHRDTVRQHAPEIKQALVEAKQARTGLKQLAARSRAGDREAQAAVKIFSIVHASRQKVRAMTAPNQKIPGILVTQKARLLRGNWLPA